jgi:hypothetical protein
MNKENVLIGIIGLLLGCVIGFMYANSINQGAVRPVTAAGMPSNTAGTGSDRESEGRPRRL